MTEVPRPRTVTLFDLDGVLSRKDTMAALVVHLVARRPHRALLIAPVGLLAALLPLHGPHRPALHRLIVRLTLGRTNECDYLRSAHRVAAGLARKPENAPASALRAWQEAATAGDVVVVTAAEQRMATHYLESLGIRPTRLVGSQLTFDTGRARWVTHNIGARKIDALLAAGVPIKTANLYTDSASDLPLARVVASVTLVNISTRSRRTFHTSGITREVTW